MSLGAWLLKPPFGPCLDEVGQSFVPFALRMATVVGLHFPHPTLIDYKPFKYLQVRNAFFPGDLTQQVRQS